MKKNLRETILHTAIHSFMTRGYENTTMRSIASDLNLAVGNINYYYHKKEDIVKDYHNAVLDAFLLEVLPEKTNDNSWLTYLTTEYAFMNYIALDKNTNEVYKSFTQVQALRDFYIDKHQELFLTIFKVLPNTIDEIYLSTLAMCSLEFELISKINDYKDKWDFDDIIYHIFETRISFLHLDINEYKDIIQESIKKGKKLQSYFPSISKKILEL